MAFDSAIIAIIFESVGVQWVFSAYPWAVLIMTSPKL
jgi:hypothetical protein